MKIEQDVPLKNLTTFGIGGRAKFFEVMTNINEALEAIQFARKQNLPIFVLGGGSNILVSDEGFDGLVIKNEIKAFKVKENFVTVGAGENWDEVVKKTIEAKFQGIECLSGIPGTFGGAIVQNIGAYGQTLSDVVDSVEVIDIGSAQVKVLSKEECEFEYRNSLFKKNQGKYLIIAAILKLQELGFGNISFYSLKEHFKDNPRPSLTDVRKAVLETRASKGMVIMPEFESYKSAGSYFKNPIVSPELFEKIEPKINCQDPWFWTQSSGIKLSAACLVTQAGFSKGQILDSAQISPKQPLALINPGFAKAADIVKLAQHIKASVRSKFGVELEEEIIYVGKIN